MTRTPGPYKVDNFCCEGDHALRIAMPDIRTRPGATIAMVFHNWNTAEFDERRISWKEAEDTAAFIVLACNAHDDLVDALQALVDSFEKHRPKELWDAARAALAKAKEPI